MVFICPEGIQFVLSQQSRAVHAIVTVRFCFKTLLVVFPYMLCPGCNAVCWFALVGQVYQNLCGWHWFGVPNLEFHEISRNFTEFHGAHNF